MGRARSCPAPATRRWLRVGEGGPRGGAFPQERPTWRSANTQVAGAAGAASIPRSGDNTSNTAPIRPGEAGRVSEGRRRHLPRCGCQAGDLRPMPLQRAASVIGARAGSLPTCFRPCAPSAQRRPHPRARPAAPGGPLSVRRRTAGMRPDRQRRTAVKIRPKAVSACRSARFFCGGSHFRDRGRSGNRFCLVRPWQHHGSMGLGSRRRLLRHARHGQLQERGQRHQTPTPWSSRTRQQPTGSSPTSTNAIHARLERSTSYTAGVKDLGRNLLLTWPVFVLVVVYTATAAAALTQTDMRRRSGRRWTWTWLAVTTGGHPSGQGGIGALNILDTLLGLVFIAWLGPHEQCSCDQPLSRLEASRTASNRRIALRTGERRSVTLPAPYTE